MNVSVVVSTAVPDPPFVTAARLQNAIELLLAALQRNCSPLKKELMDSVGFLPKGTVHHFTVRYRHVGRAGTESRFKVLILTLKSVLSSYVSLYSGSAFSRQLWSTPPASPVWAERDVLRLSSLIY